MRISITILELLVYINFVSSISKYNKLFDGKEETFYNLKSYETYYFTIKAQNEDTIKIQYKLKNSYTKSSFKLYLIEHYASNFTHYQKNPEYKLDLYLDSNMFGYLTLKNHHTIYNNLANYITLKIIPQQNIDFLSIYIEIMKPDIGIVFLILFAMMFMGFFCWIFYFVAFSACPPGNNLFLIEYAYGPKDKEKKLLKYKKEENNTTPMEMTNK